MATFLATHPEHPAIKIQVEAESVQDANDKLDDMFVDMLNGDEFQLEQV